MFDPNGNQTAILGYYTATSSGLVKRRLTMLCCPYCSYVSTILINIIEPESDITMLNSALSTAKLRG